jgi:hypothetical protein
VQVVVRTTHNFFSIAFLCSVRLTILLAVFKLGALKNAAAPGRADLGRFWDSAPELP